MPKKSESNNEFTLNIDYERLYNVIYWATKQAIDDSTQFKYHVAEWVQQWKANYLAARVKLILKFIWWVVWAIIVIIVTFVLVNS